jgi:hypothetical protein
MFGTGRQRALLLEREQHGIIRARAGLPQYRFQFACVQP